MQSVMSGMRKEVLINAKCFNAQCNNAKYFNAQCNNAESDGVWWIYLLKWTVRCKRWWVMHYLILLRKVFLACAWFIVAVTK